MLQAHRRASSLNGPIGPHRRWAWARSELSRRQEGPHGARRHGQRRGADRDHRRLPRAAALPRRVDRPGRAHPGAGVGAHGARSAATYNNRVSAMFADLPVGIEDPVERLASIHAQMDGLKESQAGRGRRGADVALRLRAGDAARAGPAGRDAGMPQRNVNTVTTNVPGPQHAALRGGPADARVLPVRAARRPRARRRRDLLLRRRAELRRHRRLRHGAGHRRALRGHRALDGRAGRGRRSAGAGRSKAARRAATDTRGANAARRGAEGG